MKNLIILLILIISACSKPVDNPQPKTTSPITYSYLGKWTNYDIAGTYYMYMKPDSMIVDKVFKTNLKDTVRMYTNVYTVKNDTIYLPNQGTYTKSYFKAINDSTLAYGIQNWKRCKS